MARWLGGVLVMLVVATMLAACGSDDDGGAAAATARARPQTRPAVSPSANDVARAKRALVRLPDFPDGWSETGGSIRSIDCGGFQPFRGANTLVRSRRLTLEEAGVQERIAIYPTAVAARRALARLDSRRAARCLRRELRRRVSDEAGGPAGPAELVRFDRLGPAAHATRYVSTSVSSYGKVVGFIDAVHVREGHAVAALVFVSGPMPLDQALYDDVVAIVLRRLRTAPLG